MPNDKIEKVSIIISRGSLEGVYPGLIMANGARMEGIDANLFFTFFGLHAIVKKKMNKIKIATVGNPALCVPTPMGAGHAQLDGRDSRHVMGRHGDDEKRNGED
jgi:peroxiredoxin family protein